MRIFCKYKGIKGFVKLYNDALRYQYMITKKALRKARVLAFWEKHGLPATAEAFGVKRRTLFLWKRKLKEAEGKFEGLNKKKTTEKLYPELKEFCDKLSPIQFMSSLPINRLPEKRKNGWPHTHLAF